MPSSGRWVRIFRPSAWEEEEEEEEVGGWVEKWEGEIIRRFQPGKFVVIFNFKKKKCLFSWSVELFGILNGKRWNLSS